MVPWLQNACCNYVFHILPSRQKHEAEAGSIPFRNFQETEQMARDYWGLQESLVKKSFSWAQGQLIH